MKVLAYITGLTLFAISVSVSAIPTPDTVVRVGDVKPSSDAAEAQFISEYLGEGWSDIWFYKVDGSAGTNVGADGGWTDLGNNVWQFDFGGVGVHHFLIKGPDGNMLTYTDQDGNKFTGNTFLFENTDQYAVIDLSVFSRTKTNKNGTITIPVTIDVISHVGAVPEPSIAALLGIGLLGLVFVHRRSRKKNLH